MENMASSRRERYDYFIAGKWKKRDTLLAIAQALEAKGRRVYCFAKDDPELAEEADIAKVQKDFAQVENWREDSRLRQAFKMDKEALQHSEMFVLVQPAGTSSSMESGMAYAWGKRCVLVGDHPPDGNLNPDGDSLLLIFHECYPNPEAFLASVQELSTA